MRVAVLLAGVVLMLAPDASGQWGPRGCAPQGPVGPVSRVGLAASRVWHESPNDPGRWGLFVNGVQVGGYCTRGGVYRSCDAVSWHAPSAPPADLPARAKHRPAAAKPKPKGCGCAAECGCKASLCACAGDTRCADACDCERAELVGADDPVTYNGGVNLEKLKEAEKESYRIGGSPASRQEVVQALVSAGKLADDRAKLRLTLIGAKADCDRALAELPAHLKERWLVQSYRPDSWVAQRGGFVTTGTPTIYLQKPPDPQTGYGEVLWRQDSYQVGDWDAFWKADPNYKKDRDPGPHQPGPLPIPLPANVPWTWVIAAGAVVLFLLLRRKP